VIVFEFSNSAMQIKRPLLVLCFLVFFAPTTVLAEIQLFGDNPIFSAIKANDLEGVKAAVARGEKPEIEDFDGRNPLIYAGIIGNADVIDYLAKIPVSINHRDKLGNSALYYAADQGHIDAVEALLESGAAIDTENRRGLTPLMAAAGQGKIEILRILLEKGADATRRDYTGRTALMWSEWNRKRQASKILRAAGVRE